VLDILFERAHYYECLVELSSLDEPACLSVLTVSHCMYFAEQKKLDLIAVRAQLEKFLVLSVSPEDSIWAFDNYAGRDYEDALQVACALRHGCTKFLTLDKDLARKYARDIKVKLVA
jgi:predicted nucleic acid-binding protein